MSNLVKSLNSDQKLQAASKILGYRELPPTIRQFIQDPYFLGDTPIGKNLYPIWLEHLEEIFPSAIHTRYHFIVLTGAIGTGKSTFSKIVGLYNKCRMAYLENLDWFGIAVTKPISWVWFHTTTSKARSDFIDSCYMIASESPFFQELNSQGTMIPMQDTADGPRSNNGIGGDVIFYNLSEINFIRRDKAEHKMDTAFKRWTSRFQGAVNYLGNIILDTSSQGDDSVVEDFIKANPYKVKVVRVSTWDAKRHLNIYFQQDPMTFKVYSGDSVHEPFIIESEDQITMKMDSDRIIEVPSELLSDFRFNIHTALQDQAGISTVSTGKYLTDISLFTDRLLIENSLPDVDEVDFYDMSDKLIDHIRPQLEAKVSKDLPLFIRFDIGVVRDKCGVAITQFDEWIPYGEGSKLKRPSFITPLHIALSRRPGQETSISHLHEFILDLAAEGYVIGEVTTDQYASRQLLQDLKRDGFLVRSISVDRSDGPYIYFKNLFKSGLWKGCVSELAEYEVRGLLHQDGKVDHPSDGSKDLMDAIVGSVKSANDHLESASTLVVGKIATNYASMYQMIKEQDGSSEVQDLFNNIF